MELGYRPAGGEIGAPSRVEVFAYAPWQRQVRVREVLSIGARGARWQGPPWITGLTSRPGRRVMLQTVWLQVVRHRPIRR
jgi:hypothetical protein